MQRLRSILGRRERHKIGFTSLAEELIQEVLRYLRWPTDLYTLSLVCRVLHRHATAELYSTLVIAYNRPERIIALLTQLEKEPQRLFLVRTLVFDEDVKSIGPNLNSRGKWPHHAHPRELSDGWGSSGQDTQNRDRYPDSNYHVDIARKLQQILPRLSNITRVFVRSIHPQYAKCALPSTELPDVYIDDHPHTSLPWGGSIWPFIFARSPRITSIYVSGDPNLNGHPGIGLYAGMVSALTTICISDIYTHDEHHIVFARRWNAILRQAHDLRSLCMVNVHRGDVILDGLFFPQLQALELFKVYLADPHDPDSNLFLAFLSQHSLTLHTLAFSSISSVWDRANHAQWLTDESILTNLHTLRLSKIPAILLTFEGMVYAGDPSSPPEENRRRWDTVETETTETIIEFVRKRPQIIDLGVIGMKCLRADEFAQELTTTRAMRNLCIGTAQVQSMENRMRNNSRFREYGREAWAFYEFFRGLAVTESGFRPRLGQPAWKVWKKSGPTYV